MSRNKLFAWVAVLAESVGFGMIFGYILGNGDNNTALWVAGILIFLGAISLGMAISAGQVVKVTEKDTETKTAKKN